VHFSRTFSSPFDIGHRALAANLSDLAAMGAAPAWALLSLMLPARVPVADVESLVDGVAALARETGTAVVGGNITRSPGPLVVDITAGGEVGARRWLTRGGGQAGDELWLSGSIGAARAGLEMLRDGLAVPGSGHSASAALDRYRRPTPRVRLGLAVARGRAARAAIDLSDGLADAVRQMAAASGCGARLDAGVIPIDVQARHWWEQRGRDPVIEALSGGDDYELLFAVPPRWGGRLRSARRHAADAMTRIGVLTKRVGAATLIRQGKEDPLPEGYEHFRD
jgi:thiamine-monophosphate kinase